MSWQIAFVDMLAIMASASEVWSRPVFNQAGDKVIGYVPAVRADHRHRGDATRLLARSVVERLESGPIKYGQRGPGGSFLHFAFEAYGDSGAAGGPGLAAYFATYGHARSPSFPSGGTWRGFTGARENIPALVAAAAAIQASMGTTAAASAALDPALAAQCAAELVTARAAFAQQLAYYGFS